MKRIFMPVAIVVMLLLASAVLAQSSANYSVRWRVMANGGQAAASASFVVNGTVSQVWSGPPESISSSYVLNSGYWVRATAIATPVATATATPLTTGTAQATVTGTAVTPTASTVAPTSTPRATASATAKPTAQATPHSSIFLPLIGGKGN